MASNWLYCYLDIEKFSLLLNNNLIMRSLLLVVATVLFSFSLATAQQSKLPEITVQDLAGKKVNIQDYAENGKITVLNFWATWCVPCKKELDNITELYPEWTEKYNMELLAISIDDPRSARRVKPMVDAKAWDFEVLLDQNSDLKRALNFQTVPYTIILDAEGNIAYSHGGYTEGYEYELETIIAELAGVSTSEDKPKKRKKKEMSGE